MKNIIIIILIIILIVFIYSYTQNNTNKSEESLDMKTTDDIFAEKEVKISIAKAKELIEEDKDLLILDTRTVEEYNAGHLEGAILIPYDQLDNRIDEIEGYEDKPLLVYCRTGNRSAVAVDILIDNGFNKIYHMNGGYSKWK